MEETYLQKKMRLRTQVLQEKKDKLLSKKLDKAIKEGKLGYAERLANDLGIIPDSKREAMEFELHEALKDYGDEAVNYL